MVSFVVSLFAITGIISMLILAAIVADLMKIKHKIPDNALLVTVIAYAIFAALSVISIPTALIITVIL